MLVTTFNVKLNPFTSDFMVTIGDINFLLFFYKIYSITGI